MSLDRRLGHDQALGDLTIAQSLGQQRENLALAWTELDQRITCRTRAAGELVHATKSHHHQGVDQLGEGLVATGVSLLDELPEAIELTDAGFVLGVQWHPEADLASSVVASLVDAAAASRVAE